MTALKHGNVARGQRHLVGYKITKNTQLSCYGNRTTLGDYRHRKTTISTVNDRLGNIACLSNDPGAP